MRRTAVEIRAERNRGREVRCPSSRMGPSFIDSDARRGGRDAGMECSRVELSYRGDQANRAAASGERGRKRAALLERQRIRGVPRV